MLVEALPSAGIHLNHRCAGVVETDDETEVRFENGVTARFDLIIGADGNRSTVRRSLGFDVPATSEGMMAYRGLIPVDRLAWAHDLRGLVNWTGPGRSFLCYPVSAGAVINVVAFVRTDREAAESWRELGDVSALAAEYAGWDERVGQTIAALDETYVWGVYDRSSLERWSTRRATLLGDAAHAMVPHLGQGAGQSIEDAFTLGALLRDANGSDIGRVLKGYEDLRKDRTTRVQALARESGQFYRRTYSSPEQRNEALLAFMKNARWVMEYDAEAAILSYTSGSGRKGAAP
jgi:salicylate hydroxylase